MTIDEQVSRPGDEQGVPLRRRPRRRWPGRRTTRTAAVVAASALAVPFGLVGAGAASAATARSPLVGHWRGGGHPGGYAGSAPYAGAWSTPYAEPYPGASGGSSGARGTGSETTRVATAAESAGLVEITSTLDFGEGEAAGTGMVIGRNGLVVTNHHVIADSTRLVATVVSTGRTYRVRVLGYDAQEDVALVRLVGASGLTTVSTTTAAVQRGDQVVAVGDAGGDGGSLTASAGTVTAPRRSITVNDDDGGSSRLRREIEVAADVIAGDSGGALYDAGGDVVGMNVAASTGGASVSGYAIPIARVEGVVSRVLSGDDSGAVTLGYPGFLGVELSSGATTPAVAAVMTGSAAAHAGLAVGDTITAVGGTSTPTVAALRSAVAAHRAGDSVSLAWTDATGAAHTATAVLRRGPVG
jgi:S1-C subfamily serine protease